MRNSNFQIGSGCFTCCSCGKKTRETGDGNSDCELCPVCFLASGLGNNLADNYCIDYPWGHFEGLTTIAQVEAKYEELKSTHEKMV